MPAADDSIWNYAQKNGDGSYKIHQKGDAVLDPFSVFEKGEELLRRALMALSPWHLVNIIQAYELSAEDPVALGSLMRPTLVELVVSTVRRQVRAPTAR